MTVERNLPYLTLIEGVLEQQSALSIGGNEGLGHGDAPLARDGAGGLVLRGSGLAGALVATARGLVGLDQLPVTISAGSPKEQSKRRDEASGSNLPSLFESVWRFYNSHPTPEQSPCTEMRSGVGIRQATGAAAEGIKFETEAVPTGTRWSFLLAVEELRDIVGPKEMRGFALPIALKALREWEDNRCILGRDPARGLGWCRLVETRIHRLIPEDAVIWPNAHERPEQTLAKIRTLGRDLSEDDRLGLESRVPLRDRCLLTGTCTLHIEPSGESDDVWGIDSLSVGASEAARGLQENATEDFCDALPRPPDQEGGKDPDLVLAWTRPTSTPGKPLTPARPFIPGSGLRGTLRHALSRWLRREGEQIIDPNTESARKHRDRDPDPVEALFGHARHSAPLLISDAELIDPRGDPTADGLWFQELHAEDEFSAATCGAQKFNRLSLVRGRFLFRYLVETRDRSELETCESRLDLLRRLGRARRIPVGGANWRGHGWVRWEWQPDVKTPTRPKRAETA